MFFLRNKNKKISSNVFLKNYTSWFDRFLVWNCLYYGFFFDDIFASSLKRFLKLFLIIPGFFFFDKYFSYWTSYNFFKKNFFFLSNYIYIENINNKSLLIILVKSVFIFVFVFCFLFFLI